MGRATDPAARGAARAPFRPLVQTYGTARYRDVDPTLFTAVSFVLMFGMMFGDAGHGLVLARLALWLRGRAPAGSRRYRHLWVIPFAAGLAAACFGVLYGELFGPTKVLPTLWLDPIDEPEPLLLLALAVGAVLLLVSYLIGIANRWRESGPPWRSSPSRASPGSRLRRRLILLAAGFYSRAFPAEIVGAVVGSSGSGCSRPGSRSAPAVAPPRSRRSASSSSTPSSGSSRT